MRTTNVDLTVFLHSCIFSIALSSVHGAETAPEKFIWNGLNPFFQPAHTLNYYGSGDVDNSCCIDGRDLDSLERLVALKAASNYRADINGDGAISREDVALLKAHLDSGAILPSHWNALTKEQRVSWLRRCLDLDITSTIPAAEDNFVCGNFASQFYFDFSYFGGNLAHTTYTGGGTIFNIPVYSIGINGHALNAVCIGDNPLEFKDWCFIEPQNFRIVDPVPPGEGISFTIVTYVIQSAQYTNEIIDAMRTQEGWIVRKTAKGFITVRPSAPEPTAYIDMIPTWNPRVVPGENATPMLFFERLNDRLPPSTSIYMASVKNGTISDISPLISDTMAARLFDVHRSPYGRVGILWRGTQDFKPALFSGEINFLNKTVENISVYTGARLAKAGTLCITSAESRGVFWLTDQPETPDNALLQGINQSTIVKGSWSTPRNVDAFDGIYFTPSWSRRLVCNYLLNALALQGNPIVISVPQPWQSSTSTIHARVPSADGWKDFRLSHDSLVAGARAAIDGENTIHCIYWATYQGPVRLPEGKVMYRTFKGSAWSEPIILDSSVNNRCTDIAVNDRNDLLTVWEKAISKETSVFCTRVYCKGSWRPVDTQKAPESESVWYPRITALQDTNYVVTWESRGMDKTQVRCAQRSYSPGFVPASPEKIVSKRQNKLCARLQGNQVLVTFSCDTPAPGSIAIYDARGSLIRKTQNTDVRRILLDLRTIGSGFRFVTVASGNEKYTAKIIVVAPGSI